ncbi:MAG: hypothetical protein K1X94_24025 [Sandaracinaceae bacterium]|nr:hypothetical protein [Sandaracinaceae bacterium]
MRESCWTRSAPTSSVSEARAGLDAIVACACALAPGAVELIEADVASPDADYRSSARPGSRPSRLLVHLRASAPRRLAGWLAGVVTLFVTALCLVAAHGAPHDGAVCFALVAVASVLGALGLVVARVPVELVAEADTPITMALGGHVVVAQHVELVPGSSPELVLTKETGEELRVGELTPLAVAELLPELTRAYAAWLRARREGER